MAYILLWALPSRIPGRCWEDNKPDRLHVAVGRLEERIFGRLDDDTWFHPGHGKDSTLGAERPHLEEWRARSW